MAGIGGFAEGFSSGLGQGMGIIRDVRQDKRAQREQEKRHEMMDAQNKRAEAAEARTAEMHPIQLESAQQLVEKYKQDIQIGGVEYAIKSMQRDWMPKQLQQQWEQGELNMELAQNQDQRADLSLAESLRNGAFNREMGRNQDARASQMHDVQIAGTVLPVAAQFLSEGIPLPPQMQRILENSPFGFAQQFELAEASKQFPVILEQASKGDFSFMKNGEMRESAFSLARPTAMRIARQKGFDANSARISNMTMGKDGIAWLEITARDPKTNQFRTVKHGVNPNGLVEQMDMSSRNGMALAAHPAFAQMQQALPGYLRSIGGKDVRAEAGKAWDAQVDVYQKAIENGEDDPNYARAVQWMQANGDRQKFIENMAAGSVRAQNGRGDASPTDWNRVSATVSRATGMTDPQAIQTRANGALSLMSRLGSVKTSQIPGIKRVITENARKTGRDLSDPAFSVQMYYAIQADPELRNEMAGALKGGSGKGNPSVKGSRYEGGIPSYKAGLKAAEDAGAIVGRLFGEQYITQNKRDPNSALGRKNPNSWHNHTAGAVDIRPIPGMTFEQAKRKIEKAGYPLIHWKDEVNKPSSHATGPHWHFVLGQRGGIPRHSINGTDLKPYGYSRY
jgi:hypothetical protein